MEERASQLSDRFLDYAVEIVRMVAKLRKTFAGREISGQVLRSGTSAGANYQEACGAQSRADFIHKLQIVFKELRESHFWLRLIVRADICKDEGLDRLIEETEALISIIARSLITAKKSR